MKLYDAKTGKREDKIFTTPVGEALFPYLDRPDTKFGQSKYRVGLLLEPGDVPAVQEAIVAVFRAAFPHDMATVPRMPLKLDRDGRTYMVCKSDFAPWLHDAGRQPIEAVVRTGDRIRLTGRARPFRSVTVGQGVALYLSGVELTAKREPRDPPPADDASAACPF